MKSGIHKDMSFSEYLAIKCASKGALHRILTRTPAETYLYMHKESDTEQKEHLKKGQLLHAAILEPEKVKEQFIVEPKFDKRYKEEKAAAEVFKEQATAAGKTVVTQDSYREVVAMSTSLWSHPMSRTVLEKVENVEVTALWEAHGVPCRARADFITSNGWIVDLKTTKDLADFGKEAYKYGYDIQYSHYIEGFRVCGMDVKGFIFIAVDNSEHCTPELVRCFDLTKDLEWVNYAALRHAEAMKRFAKCWKSEQWPGYAKPEFEPLTLPAWAKKEIESNLLEGKYDE